jgi:hypothetical protein
LADALLITASFGSHSNVIIKVLEKAPSKTEIAATNAAGQLVDSGVVDGEHVMIQNRAPGSELLSLLTELSEAQRTTVENNIKPVIAKKAVDLANKTQFWHK